MRPVALVVDDQYDCRQLAEIYLSQMGYDVETACDGDEALEIIRRNPNRFSVMITDCMMPRMIGPCLIQKLHEHNHSIDKIILSSALSPTDEPIASLLECGYYQVQFIPKGARNFRAELEAAVGGAMLGPQAAAIAQFG